MQQGQPSRTAERVALERAAHQLLDFPLVLEDPLAIRVIAAELRHEFERHPARHDRSLVSKPTRALVVVRTRIAEDTLASSGATQYVLLGAGLDTFAYRNPLPQVRVFEVDHPSTQALKRERLNAAGIALPASLMYVRCDFSKDRVPEVLNAAGFDRSQPSVFAWLGVVMYLERADIDETLRYVATMPAGSAVIFDYVQPPEESPWLERFVYRTVLKRLVQMEEPWKSFLRPAPLRQDLLSFGFSSVEDLSGGDLNRRFLSNRSDGLKAHSIGRVVIAVV